MGNLRSVQGALEYVGKKVIVTDDPKLIEAAPAVVLPGVGAFGDAIKRLEETGLGEAFKDSVKMGKPCIGICLGLQLLFSESEEGGLYKGLNIISGRVTRFSNSSSLNFFIKQDNVLFRRKSKTLTKKKGLSEKPEVINIKVPHMGWNQLNIKKPEIPVFNDVPDGSYMYFVHSYYVSPDDKSVIAATTDYSIEFTSAIAKGNLFATQFHPEKSQEVGLKILRNFILLAED